MTWDKPSRQILTGNLGISGQQESETPKDSPLQEVTEF